MRKIKRVYEPPSTADGFRLLVDRLWPRGLAKDKAQVDLWLRDIAPSDRLRKWFAHDPKKWPQFKKRYAKELESKKALLGRIHQLERERKTITLLFGTKEEKGNNAVALNEILRSRRA